MRYNFVKPTVLLVIGLLVAVNWQVLASAADIHASEDATSTLLAITASVTQGNGYGPIISTPPYAYEPSAVRLGSNNLYVWTCGQFAGQSDVIYLTIFNTDHPTSWQNAVWGPAAVLLPSYAPDAGGACSPSVVYSGSLFRMYYECATRSSPNSHPRICYAVSSDGMNWTKVGVIPVPAAGGNYDAGIYGIGHPSALMYWANTSQTLLYYYDDTSGTQKVEGVILDSNGTGILGGFSTNMAYPAAVKYYPPPNNGMSQAYFVATSNSVCVANACPQSHGEFGIFTSPDGMNFTSTIKMVAPGGSTNVTPPDPPNGSIVTDPGQLIADSDGWIRSYWYEQQVLIGTWSPGTNAYVYVTQFKLHP
jgi:hypothetical protein